MAAPVLGIVSERSSWSLVAAGGGMMGQAFPHTISRTAAVVAPGPDGDGDHLVHGQSLGAHLNPAVSIAFALRGNFPWQRVPGYIVASSRVQRSRRGFSKPSLNVSASYGSNYPASDSTVASMRSSWRPCSRSASSA